MYTTLINEDFFNEILEIYKNELEDRYGIGSYYFKNGSRENVVWKSLVNDTYHLVEFKNLMDLL